MSLSKEELEEFPIFNLLDIIDDVQNYNIDSKLSDIEDMYDYVNFIIEVEKLYNISIYDCEIELFSEFKVTDLHDLLKFLKGESDSNTFIDNWIYKNIDNLSKIRPIYLSILREDKLDKLFK